MEITRRGFMGSAVAGTVVAAGALLSSGALTGCTKKQDPDGSKPEAPRGGAVLLKNVRLITDPTVNTNVLVNADGKIGSIGENVAADGTEMYDCNNALLMPSFVDPHVHLDKTRIGGKRLVHPVTGSVAERAAREIQLRKDLKHDPFLYGSNLVRQLVSKGTTHIRSHIDVDHDIRLKHVEAIVKLRDKYKDYVDIQLVAFPQSGLVKSSESKGLIIEAINDMGVDIIGGIDPQTFDNDRKGNLDQLFEIFEKTNGAPLDLHIHESGSIGLETFREIIRRAKTYGDGIKNRLNISHGFALNSMSDEELAAVAADFAALGFTASGAGGQIPYRLRAAGIYYGGMSDNIQDMWSPWGNGDQLERAMFFAKDPGYRDDERIMLCYDLVTKYSAGIFENVASIKAGGGTALAGHGRDSIKVGAEANLTAVQAEDAVYAVLQRPERLFTMRKGKFLMRDGELFIP